MKKMADAVFEGGGIKAVAFAGALKIMEDRGFTWRNLAGTSAGAIIASLVSVGYTAKEIQSLIQNIDYNDVVKKRGITVR